MSMAENHKLIRNLLYVCMVIGVVGVAVFVTGCTAAPVPAAQTNQTGLTVTGTGEAQGEPDVAFVEVGIDIEDEDLGAAVNQSNRIINNITSALDELGVAEEDIQTTNFNVFQDQRYDNNGPTGEFFFRVNNTVRIRIVEIEQTGEILERSLEAGANQVYGLNFTIDDPQALQDAARTEAINDAQRKAEQMASDLGVELGDPIFVSEGGGAVPFASPRFDTFAADEAISAVPVSTGQLNVSSSVTVTFEIR